VSRGRYLDYIEVNRGKPGTRSTMIPVIGGMTSLRNKNHYGHRKSIKDIGEEFFNFYAIALQKIKGSPSTQFLAVKW